MFWHEQQRSRRRLAVARTSAAQRLRRHGRCPGIATRDGRSDCGTGGDYVLAVKANQPALLEDAKARNRRRQTQGKTSLTPKDAEMDATRSVLLSWRRLPAWPKSTDFPGLKSCCPHHQQAGSGRHVERYFLMSRPYSRKEVLRIVRAHWGIENRLHWPLDVTLDEDLARNRKDNDRPISPCSAASPSTSHMAHPDTTVSLRGKLKRAGWNDASSSTPWQHMR